MNETQTLPPLFPHDPVPADWGWYDCVRLATATEMAATDNCCADCGVVIIAKVGGVLVPGKMVGHREHRDDGWAWNGPWCKKCDRAHAIADGLTVDRHAALAAAA